MRENNFSLEMSGKIQRRRGNPNHRLQNLLTITKLNTLFEVFHTEAAAIDSFAPDLSTV